MFIWGACKDAPPVETDDYLSPAKQAPVQDQERQMMIFLQPRSIKSKASSKRLV
jgi:hypothetical protein